MKELGWLGGGGCMCVFVCMFFPELLDYAMKTI
jgi:hypothetical protein